MMEDRSILTRQAPAPDTVLRYGPEQDQVADARFGLGGANRRPLVVMIHGGFWRPEFDRTHTGPMCTALAKAGWSTAAIEYRRIPGQPDVLMNDVALALQTVPALIHQHNGQVIAVGHSAGGHLALWIAAHCTSESLRGVLALGPCADLQLAHQLKLDGDAVAAFLGAAPQQRSDLDPAQMRSPSMRVSIVHGEQDAVVPISLSQSYLAKHRATHLISVPDTGHFALIDPLSAVWPMVVAELEQLSS